MGASWREEEAATDPAVGESGSGKVLPAVVARARRRGVGAATSRRRHAKGGDGEESCEQKGGSQARQAAD